MNPLMTERTKTFPLIMLTSAMLLTGCTSSQLRQDAADVAAVGVAEPIQAKLERGHALTVSEVAHLSSAGVDDEILLRNFQSSWAVYRLTVEDVGRLKAAGTGEPVINAMLASQEQYGYAAQRPAHGYGYNYYPYRHSLHRGFHRRGFHRPGSHYYHSGRYH